MQSIHTNTETENPVTTTEKEKDFWKSLPLSKHYKNDEIDQAASLLSAIASADYSNPIPTEPLLPSSHRHTSVIKLPSLLPGASVAVYNAREWRLGVFQKIDYGMYVVLVDQRELGRDDLTHAGDLDSDTDSEDGFDRAGMRVYTVRGSHMRIMCENVVYVVGDNVMATFPGCKTFYSAVVTGKFDGKWIVKFHGDHTKEEGDGRAADGHLVHPLLIFKA